MHSAQPAAECRWKRPVKEIQQPPTKSAELLYFAVVEGTRAEAARVRMDFNDPNPADPRFIDTLTKEGRIIFQLTDLGKWT